MGLFSGSKSKVTQTTENIDNRQVNTTSDSNNSIYDASTKVTTTNNITTDGGSVSSAVMLASKALDINAMQGVHAYDFADNIFSSSLDFINRNDQRALQAFDRAAMIQGDTINQLQGAYADAKGTTDSQKMIIYGVLAVAGVAVLVAVKGR